LSDGSFIATDRPRATMRDVAALAGVGLKTVSRVVNREASVSPELVLRVQRASAQLNYRPNLTASSLRRLNGRTATIGLLVEDIANPFSATLFRAIEDVARERGTTLLAGSLDEDGERERRLARDLIDRRVDGLIIVPAGADQSYLLDEQRAGTGVVFVDRPPSLLAADAVVADNTDGAASGVAQLVNAGHRRIAYVGDFTTISTARARFAGYEAALKDAAVPTADALVRHGVHDAADAEKAALELLALEHPPTAIFASQNLITIGVLRALRHKGQHRRVALVGFDDFPLADLVEPGVTVVAQDPATMGRLAAETLFRRLEGDRSPFRELTVPTQLLQRGSGEIRP
jgi:LacI family transcriptional regulator